MRLARYEDQQGRHVGVVLKSGEVVPTPWSGFEGLFAAPDPYAALQEIDLTEDKAVSPGRLLAPIVDRAQIISTGANWARSTIPTRRRTRSGYANRYFFHSCGGQ